MKAYVYHIPDPNNPGLSNGYIGVVKASKGIHKRFREHATCKSRIMHHHIRENMITEKDVELIFEGELEECYDIERFYRPHQNIGWNLAAGGGGPYDGYDAENLSRLRSKNQSERMKDAELRRQQGISFKENYYGSLQSQQLRSRRAKEHMSNPEKKNACLSGMHKKKKCPYCDYVSNAGNIAQHIKRKHNAN